MKSARGPLQRIGGSRVKSGCHSCKKRHVKCDEARPTCQKCSKAGFTCVYDPEAAAGNSRENQLRVVQYVSPLRTSGPSHLAGYTADELRGTEFYQLQTASELGGFFSTHLWSKVMLQIASVEPAVRSALLAVSALHEVFRSGDESETKKTDLATQHYSRAIHHVVNFGSAQSCNIDIVLASCILFTLVEILRGHYGAALTHVSSGLKLLSCHTATNSGQAHANVRLDLFRETFLWLDTQAVEIGDSTYRPYSMPHVSEELPPLPMSFGSIQDAYQAFNAFFNRFSRTWEWIDASEHLVSSSVPPDPTMILENCHLLHQYFIDWDEAFSKSSFNSTEPGVLVLMINKIVMHIIFSTLHVETTETAWDKSLPQFQVAAELAEQLVGTSPNEMVPPTMTTSMGIVMSIYLIATRCRDPRIRRRALRLLQRLNCREGFWDSKTAATMAGQIITLEEAGAVSISGGSLVVVTECWQIPESVRIKGLEVSFKDDSDTMVKCNTSQADRGAVTTSETALVVD